jgi:carbon starvation protein
MIRSKAMSPAVMVLVAFCLYGLAYRVYSRFLADRVYGLDAEAPTPAHTMRDDVDYLPTKPSVLFGHHFASITGLAPMLGPAVAVIWGWGPAFLWVVFGAIFVGCVHDFSAMVLSVRHRGMSVGQVADSIIGPRGRTWFHLIIFFGIALAMGVFVFIISRLFAMELAPGRPGHPEAVMPSVALMIIAMVSGVLMHKRGVRLLPIALVGFSLELLTIWLGMRAPTMGIDPASWPAPGTWTIVLLVYAFAASVLPVWALLQARDFLNGLLLYLGVGLAYLGLFVVQPSFDAPMFQAHPAGAPGILPTVFIVIACGAASGFHGLVSSGTTAKQLDKETHARPIGYGAMIGESLLALLATLACTAGLGSSEVWHSHYGDWSAVQALPVKIDLFISGTTSFLVGLGVPEEFGSALIAMVVVSFALTTLDSATRLLRFNIEEIAASARIGFLQQRYVSSALACVVIGLFAFYKVDVQVGDAVVAQPAGLALWQLFGTTNQILGALTLGLASIYLKRRGSVVWPTLVPCLFLLGSTVAAMVQNLSRMSDPLVFGVGVILLLLAVGVIVEGVLALRRDVKSRRP